MSRFLARCSAMPRLTRSVPIPSSLNTRSVAARSTSASAGSTKRVEWTGSSRHLNRKGRKPLAGLEMGSGFQLRGDTPLRSREAYEIFDRKEKIAHRRPRTVSEPSLRFRSRRSLQENGPSRHSRNASQTRLRCIPKVSSAPIHPSRATARNYAQPDRPQ